MQLEEGAVLNGTVHMGDKKKSAAPAMAPEGKASGAGQSGQRAAAAPATG
jgi:hypothetical protein